MSENTDTEEEWFTWTKRAFQSVYGFEYQGDSLLLAHDENFVYKMDTVYSAFKKYVDVEPDHQRPSIAYFSMEYGLDEVLKIYSGLPGNLPSVTGASEASILGAIFPANAPQNQS